MSLEKSIQLQEKLFSIITKKIGAPQLIYDLTKILNISKSAAYKRRRCQTLMTLSEYLLLLKAYNININDFLSGDDIQNNTQTD